MPNIKETIDAYDKIVERALSWPTVCLYNDDYAKVSLSEDGETVTVSSSYAAGDYGGGYCNETDSAKIETAILSLSDADFKNARKVEHDRINAKSAAARAAQARQKQDAERAEFERLKAKFGQ